MKQPYLDWSTKDLVERHNIIVKAEFPTEPDERMARKIRMRNLEVALIREILPTRANVFHGRMADETYLMSVSYLEPAVECDLCKEVANEVAWH